MYSPIELVIRNFISHSDSKYVFKNGVATLIYGVNHDDDGQASNGSGKSAFIEAISIALTGSPFRNVRTVELIKNGEKDCEIDFTLDNSFLKSKLRIYRRLYSNSKSSECKIWINDVLIGNLTSVNESNKFILDQLDISREDLINYFIIAKGSYTSFFGTSDTKKKELISRFSNADSIAQVEPIIQDDIDLINSKINTLNSSITSTEAKIEVYKEQLEEVDIEVEKTEKENLLKRLDDSAHQARLKAIDCRAKIVIKKSDIEDIDEEISKINIESELETKSTLEKSDEDLKVEIKDLQSLLINIPSVFKKKLDGLARNIEDGKESISEIEEEKSDLDDFIYDLEKTIKGSVECPECSHKFSIGNKDLNIEECISSLKDSKEMVLELDSNIIEGNNSIKEIRDKINKIKIDIKKQEEKVEKNINDLRVKQSEITKKLNIVNSEISELKSKERSLKSDIEINNSEIKILEASALNAENQCKQFLIDYDIEKNKDIVDKTIDIKQKIKESTKKLEEFNTLLEVENSSTVKLEEWILNFKKFKSFLANKSIASIGGFTNMYLDKLKSNLQVSIEGYKILANGKIKEEITTQILKNGVECGSFDKLSGGEKVRIEVCLILALQRLINLNSKSGGLNLCVMDEILESLDSKGLDSIIHALENINQTIMLITHGKVESNYSNIVVVQKQNGNSVIM